MIINSSLFNSNNIRLGPVVNAGPNSRLKSGGGLYIHVPFCRKKCIYCDFYSIGLPKAEWSRYIYALIAELNHRIEELPIQLNTIYIGGGTPSLMPEKNLIVLMSHLRPYMENIVEFTLEVNPEDVTPQKIDVWKRIGVNRISMGIQSFDNSILASIKRRHSAEDAIIAYSMLRDSFDNVSIDLIFGIPGQTLDMLLRDIHIAIELRPKHISFYSLMYEPGTALTILRDKRKLEEATQEICEKMWYKIFSSLSDAEYDHYEISNFALPGFRSVHNSSYWNRTPYLGIGPSAHSYDGLNCRSANRKNVTEYIDYWECKKHLFDSTTNGFPEREYLSEDELIEEFIMTALRTREGISLDEFTNAFGKEITTKIICKSQPWINRNLMVINNGNLSLSEDAILISDSIILDLI